MPKSTVRRGQNPPPHRQQVGDECHLHLGHAPQGQGSLDLGLVLVAQDPIGADVIGHFGKRHLFVRLAARAGGSALGVDDHGIRCHEARAQERQHSQNRRRWIAAWIGNQPGRAQLVEVVGGFGHAVHGLSQQIRCGMGKAVPLRELFSRQPESARQVHHPRTRVQRARRQLDRNIGRRAQKDHVHLAQVGLAIFVRQAGQVRRGCCDGNAVAQALAGPLVAGHQAKGKVRMAGQNARQLHAGIARHADDAGSPG